VFLIDFLLFIFPSTIDFDSRAWKLLKFQPFFSTCLDSVFSDCIVCTKSGIKNR